MIPFMSRTELDILQADDVRLIKYYTLSDGTAGLLLICRGKNYINLCERDECWTLLTRKADSLYLKFPEACADEHTREILEGRKNVRSLNRFEFLTKMRLHGERAVNYSTAAFSENFVGYFLSELYGGLEAEFSLIETKGYRERFCIRCKVNGEEKNLPCEFAFSGNEYTYKFGNFFKPAHSAQIRIRYDFGCAEIIAGSRTERVMRYEFRYDFINGMITRRIFEAEKMIFSQDNSFKPDTDGITERVKEICGSANYEYNGYTLPWGEKIFFRKGGSDGEFIADNDGGKIIQIYRSYPHEKAADELCAVHEIFGQGENLFVQTAFSGEKRGRAAEKEREGFYYRRMKSSDIREIGEDLSDMTAAQVLEKYLRSK